jgi:hypothetical protein
MIRLLPLLLMIICLVSISGQSVPNAKALGGCELVCGEPFIDPQDGHCYQVCCPEDDLCGVACQLRRCPD